MPNDDEIIAGHERFEDHARSRREAAEERAVEAAGGEDAVEARDRARRLAKVLEKLLDADGTRGDTRWNILSVDEVGAIQESLEYWAGESQE